MSNEALIKFLQAGHTFEISTDLCDSPVVSFLHASKEVGTWDMDIYDSVEMDAVCALLLTRPVWQEIEVSNIPKEEVLRANSLWTHLSWGDEVDELLAKVREKGDRQ